IELRALADLGVPRRIGVPAATAIVDRFVDLAVGLARAHAHHRELGIVGMAGAPHAMRLHPAEAARVGQELGDGERLAAYHPHDAVEPGLGKALPVGIRQGAHIDTGGDGADAWVGLVDLHGESLASSQEEFREETMHRIAAAVFALVLGGLPAAAQEAYPNKPITLIVPYAPGG